MDIEKIQKQVTDLKTGVSLLEQSYANEFYTNLTTSLHEIANVLDSLQPRIIDPADLSKEAEQKVLNTLSDVTARLDAIEQREWTEDSIEEVARTTVRNMDFDCETEVWAK